MTFNVDTIIDQIEKFLTGDHSESSLEEIKNHLNQTYQNVDNKIDVERAIQVGIYKGKLQFGSSFKIIKRRQLS